MGMAFPGARCRGPTRPRGVSLPGGTTRNPYAQYSERGPDYIYNMERLLRKFRTRR
jgi:2-oxoglutarate ferredoxin oxidoreductase subunit alpha